MSHTIYLEDNDLEIEVEDPSSPESWVEALSDFMSNAVENCYYNQYEKIDNLSYELIIRIVNETNKAIEGAKQSSSSEVPFKKTLSEKLFEGMDESGLGEELSCDYEYAMQPIYKALSNIEEDIERAMEQVDGPVCDCDDVVNLLKDYGEQKVFEKDDSTILDAIGDLKLPFILSPGMKPDSDAGDTMIHTGNFYGDSSNIKGLLRLMGVKGRDFLDAYFEEIDFNDEPTMSFVDEIIDFEPGVEPVIDASELIEMIDNSSSYARPQWCGTLSINEILRVDFSKDVALTGGTIGLHDFINGAGNINCLDDDKKVILKPEDCLFRDSGYSTIETHGLSLSAYDAEIFNTETPRKEKGRAPKFPSSFEPDI